MLLYLVRHGETDWNLARRIQGNTDIPLNDTGRAQARATGELLRRHHWDGIFSSPLSRAFETTQIIAAVNGLDEPIAVPALVERNYGEAEGLEDAVLAQRFPGDTPVPGREDRSEVVARVMPALLELGETHPDQAILVVSHGGVIRSVLNEIDPGNRHPSIRNGSVHSLRYLDGALSLIRFDDPIEVQTSRLSDESLEQQNPMEARENA